MHGLKICIGLHGSGGHWGEGAFCSAWVHAQPSMASTRRWQGATARRVNSVGRAVITKLLLPGQI